MSETETSTAEKPKKSRRKAEPRKPKPPSEYAGMTVTACAAACNEAGCVVSRKPYCAHPAKGGLQGKDMGDTAGLARLEAAKKLVGKQKIDPNRL